MKTPLNVFLVYTSKELPDFETAHHKVHIVLDKLIKIVDENNTQVS